MDQLDQSVMINKLSYCTVSNINGNFITLFSLILYRMINYNVVEKIIKLCFNKGPSFIYGLIHRIPVFCHKYRVEESKLNLKNEQYMLCG